MKVILVGGGTSGHINPALNIGEYIRNQNNESKILYVGSKNGIEKEMAERKGFEFRGITTSGFSRKLNFESIKKNMISVYNIFASLVESRRILKEFEPDICIGTGGYVCGSFLYQASMMKIPFLIQEQNAIPGLTTKILSGRANFVLLGNKDASKYLTYGNCIFTGNPINNIPKESKEEMRKKLNIQTDRKVIFSFGGSLGSKTINNCILDVIKTDKYFHIHGYGRNNIDFNNKVDLDLNKNLIIKSYFYNIYEYMISSDLIICRSGAMTLSELSTLGKPVILIPSPNVTNNHQLYNAKSYASKFMASVIEEKNLNSELLISEIEKLLSSTKTPNFEENISCEKIYDIINSIVIN